MIGGKQEFRRILLESGEWYPTYTIEKKKK